MKEKILSRVKEHYDYLINKGYNVVCTILQGSQNYGLDEYSEDYISDVDTKSIVLPTLDNFVKASPPISAVEILENNEHAEVKDIRVMFDMFKKMNISYIELLFSDYVIVNPKYKQYVDLLYSYKNLIASANKIQFVKCIAGMAMEKRKALCHPYPGIIDKIEKYGYDGKQVSHAVRLWEFLDRYVNGESLQKCYKSNKKLFIIALKKQQYEDGSVMPKEDAIEICDTAVAAIKIIKDDFIEKLTAAHYEPDYEIWKILDELKEIILKEKIKEDAITNNDTILWFSNRKKLEEIYKQWTVENKVACDLFNLITFLNIKHLLNKEQVLSFLKEAEKK